MTPNRYRQIAIDGGGIVKYDKRVLAASRICAAGAPLGVFLRVYRLVPFCPVVKFY